MPEEGGAGAAKYYLEELPVHFMEAFAALDLPQFDFLILDEGQDLMRPQYLDAMDWILKGGLKDGCWFFFMDAERQDLYGAAGGADSVKAELKNRGITYTNYNLTDNCRNSVAITEKIDEIFRTKTRRRSGAERGEAVQIKTYKDEKGQLRALGEILDKLKSEGIPAEEIVLLSTVRYENSVVKDLEGWPVTTDYTARRGKMLFSTVHTFKGLDSPVVILTDINHFFFANNKMMLYVGMSRAKSVLYMLCREKTLQDIQAFSKSRQ